MENVNGSTKDTNEIKDEKQTSKDEDCGSAEGSSDSNENNDSDEEMEEPNHYCKPEQLMEALNNVITSPPDFVFKFELQHSPLLVITKTKNDDRITFPIYNRLIDDSNSLQLKSDDFQIINPSWDVYMNNFIIPKIRFKMVLDFEVRPILKSFWILQSASQVTSLVQHEFDENTIASMVIQLPSKFEGGEHQIEPSSLHAYYGRRYFNLSVKFDGKYEFSSFAMVFHRDFKQKIRPITKGVGSYLVYDLKVNDSDIIKIPKVPTYEHEDNTLSLRSMLSNWREPGKIIIGLSNEYAKDDLSLENLKSTDLAIAMYLKKQYDFLSDYGRFECFLGYMTRTYHGEVVAEATSFDTKDASNILQTEYNIQCLKHIDGKEMVYFNDFHVNFDEEVWPVKLFDGVLPYQCKRERFKYTNPWDHFEVALHVAKDYQRPVIVLFVRYNFIDELKKSYVDVADIYKIFITLHQEYERQPLKKFFDKNWARFNRWAWTISCMMLPKDQRNTKHSRELTVSFLKVLISLGETTFDTRAFINYFECSKRVLTDEIVPLLINQCNKCNWLPFSQILCDMFKEIKSFPKAEKYLNYFIDDSSDRDDDTTIVSNKPNVLQSVFKVILDKQKGEHDYKFSTFFRSAWNLANKGGLDIREYGKSEKIRNIVPFLIELAEEDANNKSNDTWLDIANHFLKIKESLNPQHLNWRRPNTKITSKCDCIKNLVDFLKDDLESTTFKLQKIHRNHFQSIVSKLQYLRFLNSEESGIANMFVLKKKKVGQQNMPEYDLKMLEKLRLIC